MQIIHRSDCGKKRFVARGKLQFIRDELLMVAEHPFESMLESYHFPLLKINPSIFHVRPMSLSVLRVSIMDSSIQARLLGILFNTICFSCLSRLASARSFRTRSMSSRNARLSESTSLRARQNSASLKVVPMVEKTVLIGSAMMSVARWVRPFLLQLPMIKIVEE